MTFYRAIRKVLGIKKFWSSVRHTRVLEQKKRSHCRYTETALSGTKSESIVYFQVA